MKSILNKMNVDTLKQPLFLGEDLSLQRYDKFKYPVFFDLYKKQLEFFWRPEEIELKKDRNNLSKAYDFALKAHEKQKRDEGSPYIIHPVAVANILTDLKLDSATIATGLLHDTIEDTLIL